MDTQIKKRLKSFAWRTGMMVIAFVANQLSIEVVNFGFSPTTTVILGLIFGEISKYLNQSDFKREIKRLEDKSEGR